MIARLGATVTILAVLLGVIAACRGSDSESDKTLLGDTGVMLTLPDDFELRDASYPGQRSNHRAFEIGEFETTDRATYFVAVHPDEEGVAHDLTTGGLDLTISEIRTLRATGGADRVDVVRAPALDGVGVLARSERSGALRQEFWMQMQDGRVVTILSEVYGDIESYEDEFNRLIESLELTS